MSQIYRLRDLAGNESLGGDFGLALKHFQEATGMLTGFTGSHGVTDVLAFYDMGKTAERRDSWKQPSKLTWKH